MPLDGTFQVEQRIIKASLLTCEGFSLDCCCSISGAQCESWTHRGWRERKENKRKTWSEQREDAAKQQQHPPLFFFLSNTSVSLPKERCWTNNTISCEWPIHTSRCTFSLQGPSADEHQRWKRPNCVFLVIIFLNITSRLSDHISPPSTHLKCFLRVRASNEATHSNHLIGRQWGRGRG